MNKYDQYQIPCLYAIRKAREGGAKKALVVMAGGLGKTIVGARDVGDFLQAGRKRVLFLCHDTGILAQNLEKFKLTLGDNYSYGFFYDNQKEFNRVDLLFATFQTMNSSRNWKEYFSKDEFAYIIVDEAHHSRANTFEEVLQYFEPEFLLGLTATPNREDGKSLTGFFGEPVFTLNFVDAWAHSYLTPVEYTLVTKEMTNVREYLEKNQVIAKKTLNSKIFLEMKDEELVEDIRERISDIEKPRMIIFCRSIKHTEKISKLYPGARALHSKLPPEVQDQNMKDFRNGDLDVIVVCDKLNEGIDVPAVDVIVRLRLTRSKLLFEQQLSRGLRLHKGKEKVRVYDYASSIDQLEQLFDYEERMQKAEKALLAEASASESNNLTNEPNHGPKSVARKKFSIILSGGEFKITKVDLKELIERANRPKTYTDEMLLEQLAKVTLAKGEALAENEIDASVECAALGTYKLHFGQSYKKDIIPALKRYMGPRAAEVDWSKADTLREARQTAITGLPIEEQQKIVRGLFSKWFKEKGCSPTKREWDSDKTLPSVSQCKRIFGKGTWNELLEAVGLTPKVDKKQNKTIFAEERMLKFLVDLETTLGRPVTGRDIDESDSVYTAHSFESKFGNLSEAKKKAGLKIGFNSRWHNDETIKNERDAALREQYIGIGRTILSELGKIPSSEELDKRPDFSVVTMRRLFGNKTAFVNALS